MVAMYARRHGHRRLEYIGKVEPEKVTDRQKQLTDDGYVEVFCVRPGEAVLRHETQ